MPSKRIYRERGYKAHTRTLFQQGNVTEARSYAEAKGILEWFESLSVSSSALHNKRYVNCEPHPPLAQVVVPPPPPPPLLSEHAAVVAPGGEGVRQGGDAGNGD